MDALTVSVILLWLAVLALGVMLWALSRQVGVLFERVAPMGALVTDAGPPVGSASPSFALTGLQSEAVAIGGMQPLPVSWALVARNGVLAAVAAVAAAPVAARPMGYADFAVVAAAVTLATLLYAAFNQLLRHHGGLHARPSLRRTSWTH